MDSNIIWLIVSFTILQLVIAYIVRKSRARLRGRGQTDLSKPRFTNPDTKPELAQFLTRLIPDDFRNDSLVHRNGKFYGASFGKDTITLRLPVDKHGAAITAGGEQTDRREWIQFRYDWGTPAPGAVDRRTIEHWIFAARDYVGVAK